MVYLLCEIVLLVSCAAAQGQTCPYVFSTDWPSSDAIWTLGWATPDQSVGVDGSGLQLTSVRYKGKQVLQMAHLPVLNVLYELGGCGDTYLSHRDWQTGLRTFEATNIVSPCHAEATAAPQTVCDHPGVDAGSFAGVAVERKADQLILTTEMQAGWYRYIQKWFLYPDGTIQARFYFTAISDYCVSKPHYHQAYWRFDFNVEGAGNDVIEEYNAATGWKAFSLETNRRKNPATDRKWRVRNQGTGRGYEIIPEPNDDIADAWGVADIWALRYHDTEFDDGGATPGPTGNAAHMNGYLDSESIKGQHDVLWYRAGRHHDSPAICVVVGVTLKPIGKW
ncbi:MAG: hypothetical protein WAO00_16970 [Chthoniobacterales bacterium]